MSVGLMRERIEIQRPADATADAEGYKSKTPWVKVASMWAQVESLQGREFESMRQINSAISKKFTVNYRREMVQRQQEAEVPTMKMRIVWAGDNWNIHDVQPGEDKFDMVLYAARVK